MGCSREKRAAKKSTLGANCQACRRKLHESAVRRRISVEIYKRARRALAIRTSSLFLLPRRRASRVLSFRSSLFRLAGLRSSRSTSFFRTLGMGETHRRVALAVGMVALLASSKKAEAQQRTPHLDRMEVAGAPDDGIALFRPVTNQRNIFFG